MATPSGTARPPSDTMTPAPREQAQNASSNSVEMNDLASHPRAPGATSTATHTPATPAPATATATTAEKPTTTADASEAPPSVEDSEAIASSNKTESTGSTEPAVNITLLLTNGARHPYKIDPKYLKKRSVDVEDDDPFNISVFTLKELIWRDWRSEWEPRPTSPQYIRLIFMGRMLEDKHALKECRFNGRDATNILHMTVKPQEIIDEEETSKAGKSGRAVDAEDRVAGCRCEVL